MLRLEYVDSNQAANLVYERFQHLFHKTDSGVIYYKRDYIWVPWNKKNDQSFLAGLISSTCLYKVNEKTKKREYAFAESTRGKAIEKVLITYLESNLVPDPHFFGKVG